MNTPADPMDLDTRQVSVQSAEDALREGRWSDALAGYSALLDRMLALRVATGRAFRAADLVVTERLAELAMLCHRCDAADDLLRAMVTLSREAGNDTAADYAQLRRAEMRLACGQLHEAFDALGQLEGRIGALTSITIDAAGVATWERRTAWQALSGNDRTVLLTRAHAVMGRILMHLGRYGEALTMLERGLHHARRAGAPDLARRAGPVLALARAEALLERGDLDAAADALATSEHEVQEELSPAARVHVNTLWGRCHLLRGELGDAVRRLECAMALCHGHRLARAGAVSALNLAHCFVLLNRVGEAIALVDRVRLMAIDTNDAVLAARTEAIHQLAIARRRSSAEAVAVALSVTAMSTGRVAPPHGTGALPRPAVLGATARGSGFLADFDDRVLACQSALGTDVAAATDQFGALEAAVCHTDSKLIHARLRVLGAQLRWAHGDAAGAAAGWTTALPALELLGLHPEVWQCRQWLAQALRQQGRATEAAAAAGQAEAELDGLADSLDSSARAVYLLDKATAEEAHVLAQLEALTQLQAAAGTAAWHRRWPLRRRLLAGLQDLLDHLERYRSAMADRQARPGRRRVTAPPSRFSRWLGPPRGRAVLVYAVLPDRLLVIWSSRLATGFVVSPVTRVALREHVRQWHEFAREAAIAACKVATDAERLQQEDTGRRLAATMSDALLLDTVLAALPAHVHNLTIVADDVLHGLPFAALPYQGHYLVERFALTMGFGNGPAATSTRHVAGPALVVGPTTRSTGQGALRAVTTECDAVTDWLRRRGLATSSFAGPEATLATVSGHLAQSAVVHLASHGAFHPEHPDQSGLRLADGRLTIRRLSTLPMRACRHVTLSACGSADHFVLPAPWTMSLPEVFWRSGADSVLASLWPAVDALSAAFMQRFYEALEHLPRDAALREVQLAFIANDTALQALVNRPVHAPFFWAGFTLSGAPGRLRLKPLSPIRTPVVRCDSERFCQAAPSSEGI